MVDKAEEVQDIIDQLARLRDYFRGEHKVICGVCYHDDHTSWEEHIKWSPGCHRMGWKAPLGIYVTEWKKDVNGRYNRIENKNGK